MDHEVAKTLGELELKLKELERELASIGQARLVDEALEQRATPDQGPALEQRYSMEARETVFGEIPATKDRHETIDIAELVRFKETMQRTLQGLIDQYSRLLSLEPPSSD